MYVGICGHIGMGKTYVANEVGKRLQKLDLNTRRDSFARKVKEFAKDIFFITKDGHYLKQKFPYPTYMEDMEKYLLQEEPNKIIFLKQNYPLLQDTTISTFLEGIITEIPYYHMFQLVQYWSDYYESGFDLEYRLKMARKMLQLIGKFGREINKDYWVKFVKENDDSNTIVLIDDLRFLNEAEHMDFIIALVPTSIGAYFELMEKRKVKVNIDTLKDVSEKEWGLIAQELLSEKKEGMFIWVEDDDSLNKDVLDMITGSIILKYDELHEDGEIVIDR